MKNVYLTKDGNSHRDPDHAYETGYRRLRASVMAEEILQLKVGAQVMCVINLPEMGLVNGSRGKVVGYTPRENGMEHGGWPVVYFFDVGREIIMCPHQWSEDGVSSSTASFGLKKNNALAIEQVPLILAWAVTIHKAQGCTLNSAEIDIGSTIFEFGQAYVALSRIKSIEGLYLESFDPQSIRANPQVSEYYQRLSNTTTV